MNGATNGNGALLSSSSSSDDDGAANLVNLSDVSTDTEDEWTRGPNPFGIWSVPTSGQGTAEDPITYDSTDDENNEEIDRDMLQRWLSLPFGMRTVPGFLNQASMSCVLTALWLWIGVSITCDSAVVVSNIHAHYMATDAAIHQLPPRKPQDSVAAAVFNGFLYELGRMWNCGILKSRKAFYSFWNLKQKLERYESEALHPHDVAGCPSKSLWYQFPTLSEVFIQFKCHCGMPKQSYKLEMRAWKGGRVTRPTHDPDYWFGTWKCVKKLVYSNDSNMTNWPPVYLDYFPKWDHSFNDDQRHCQNCKQELVLVNRIGVRAQTLFICLENDKIFKRPKVDLCFFASYFPVYDFDFRRTVVFKFAWCYIKLEGDDLSLPMNPDGSKPDEVYILFFISYFISKFFNSKNFLILRIFQELKNRNKNLFCLILEGKKCMFMFVLMYK